MEDEIIQAAMQIILHAGNAREEIRKAVEDIKNLDEDSYKKRIVNAKELLRKAHVQQTQIIQDEAKGIHHEINILFIHAQDTLMTIMSELNMLETLGSVLLVFGQKIKDNEGK